MVNTTTRILILALFVAVASAQQYCTFNSSVTKAGLYDQNGLCNCYSGFYSSQPNYLNCFNKVGDECFWNPAPQQLSTGYVPILDDQASGVFGSNIVMVVRSPLVTDRLSTTAAWQNGAADYSYPGSYWTKTVESCNDTFTFTLPLSKAYDSGFEPSEDDTYYYLNGVVVFTYYDSIGEMRGQPLTRTTQSVLRIEIRFPKRITVTSAVSVYSGYDLLAVITYQAFDPVTNTGIFEYTTSLPYPFRLENVTQLTFPAPITGTSGPVQDLDCGTSFNSTCLQKFRVTNNPNGACRLSGDYNTTVAIGCRGAASCAPGTGVISAQITSEDICSVVRLDIDLTGSMKVYSDDTFSSPAASFLPGQSAVFLTNVASSKAIIAGSSISDVFYTMPDGSSNSLYSGGATSDLASSNGFSLVPVNETANYFTVSFSVGETPTDLFNPRALDPSAFPPTMAPAAAPLAAATPLDPNAPITDPFLPPVPDPGAVPVDVAPPLPDPYPLDPILDCIEQVNSSSYIAYFSYQNPWSDFKTYPIGATNGFSGNGLTLADVGQPTIFLQQRSMPYPVGAFQYRWNGASPVSWTLNGVQRVADPAFLGNRCPTAIDFMFAFYFSGYYPEDMFEQGLIIDGLSQAMGMRSNLNLVQTYNYVYFDPAGGQNVVSIGIRIDPSIDAPDIPAKDAMLKLMSIRTNATIMKPILDPYNRDSSRSWARLMMNPLPNEMSSYFYNMPVWAKRSVDPENTLLVQENPLRREIVHSKREVEQDVSGGVQFSAVIEVEWVGLAGNKKKFAFDLKHAKSPSGSQDKKFSAFVAIGKAQNNVEPTSISTNVPNPTSAASALYVSISLLLAMAVTVLLL